MRRWQNVLLTDSGLYDPFDLTHPLRPIVDCLSRMLGKPFSEARILFIPMAACDEEAKTMASILRSELLWLGCRPDKITDYLLDDSMSEEDVMSYDVMYFTGGWDMHLLKCIKKNGFDRIVRRFVEENRIYIGVSAGSVVATPNIRGCFGDPDDPEGKGMGLIRAFVDVHCNLKPDAVPQKLPLPHIMLYTHQALVVSADGYELIGDDSAKHSIDPVCPPKIGVNIWKLP